MGSDANRGGPAPFFSTGGCTIGLAATPDAMSARGLAPAMLPAPTMPSAAPGPRPAALGGTDDDVTWSDTSLGMTTRSRFSGAGM